MRGRRIAMSIAAVLFAALLEPASATGAPGDGATAFVRVNQIGYPVAAAKRAYLLASGDESGATFAVRTLDGTAVVSGSVGADLGSWSSGYPHVYAIDFDTVSAAGTYRITVDGPIASTSPSFRIAPGTSLYRTAVRNARSFYRNERDGSGYIASALRTAPAHLND